MTQFGAFVCVTVGTIGGLMNGLFTEYFTSKDYEPVQELAESCITGAATNIIYGLALGYKSVVLPVFCLAIVIYISFHTGDLYGVALAAVGMLSTLATGLTIDGFGPVSFYYYYFFFMFIIFCAYIYTPFLYNILFGR